MPGYGRLDGKVVVIEAQATLQFNFGGTDLREPNRGQLAPPTRPLTSFTASNLNSFVNFRLITDI